MDPLKEVATGRRHESLPFSWPSGLTHGPAGADKPFSWKRNQIRQADGPRHCAPRVIQRSPAWSVQPEQAIDPAGVLAEFLLRLDVKRARMGQIDQEIIRHARGPGGEHDDARAEKDRLADAVRDEHDGLLRLLPDAQAFE